MQMEVEESSAEAARSPSPKEEAEEDEGLWVPVPEPVLAADRIANLVELLVLDICTEGILSRTNIVITRLAAVEANRNVFLTKLVDAAQAFAHLAASSLQSLLSKLRSGHQIMRQGTFLDDHQGTNLKSRKVIVGMSDLMTGLVPADSGRQDDPPIFLRFPADSSAEAKSTLTSTSLALSSSSTEYKLLRLLQTIDTLADDDSAFSRHCSKVGERLPHL